MTNKYQFKPYSDAFPYLFSQEKSRIAGSIGECLDIQHVGSSAVPGLGGKGIIDIAIAVPRKDIEAVSRKLESLGYLFRESGSAPGRWFFRADLPDEQEKIRRYHIHLTFPESSEWTTLLAFRDYLRTDPKALVEYARLKKEAAEQVNEDGEAYRRLKQPFFEKARVKRHKIYFVIGASGSGKTTAMQNLDKLLPTGYIVIQFDSIGVPTFAEMVAEYGSLEEWQRVKTLEWVERIAKEYLGKTDVILDAQTRPSFIEEACNRYDVAYEVVLFDCMDGERKKRLISRGHPELADENMMNWAKFLRSESRARGFQILDTSSFSIQETQKQFLKSFSSPGT